jgi:hypothetical protein
MVIQSGQEQFEAKPSRVRLAALLPPLLAALACTGLIIEAIVTVIGARDNGDLMVMICPILGALFFCIPAGQAWWACIKLIRRS